MSSIGNTLETSLPSADCEHQALVIAVPNDFENIVSSENPLPDLSETTTPFTEVQNSLHASNATLNVKMEIEGASTSAPSTVKYDSKPPQKKKIFEPDSSKSPKRKYHILPGVAF